MTDQRPPNGELLSRTAARGRPERPDDTRVVLRRIAQFLTDAALSSVLPWCSLALLILVPVEPDGTIPEPGLALALGSLAVTVFVVVYVGYWAVLPALFRGQTPGMRLFGVRVITDDGSEATVGQMFLRWLLLAVDGFAGGLAGLLVMLATERRQRVGDLAARTLVVRVAPPPAGGASDHRYRHFP
ncbi:putative RDD family membrane protein YckC [Haloactinospora alba]|uniref:Putative RDD family membrane protein YckC n=1 Tax=Haloactinospora alba TaxID=405555 RepID=A0A543NKA2_9ACTN|nr:RDD family protein [Haloactinospora alba]TQN32293.1 putative RDD family membrane protein YckC [Haloactinospora alba]